MSAPAAAHFFEGEVIVCWECAKRMPDVDWQDGRPVKIAARDLPEYVIAGRPCDECERPLISSES